jgi:pimeloyl-ACP methyl ester carboxylesterase
MRVLLIHGFVCDSRFWEPQVALLRGLGYEVIAPDLPFHGGPTEGVAPSLEGLADWVVGTHLQQPAVLIGHSLGGMIALQIAHDHASQVSGLALIDSFPSLELNRGLLPGMFRDMGPGDVRQWVETTRAELLLQMTLPVHDALWPTVLAFDARAWLESIACPVLGIYGGRGLYSAADAPALREHLGLGRGAGHSEVVVVEQASHFVQLERPEEVKAALGQWLAEKFGNG